MRSSIRVAAITAALFLVLPVAVAFRFRPALTAGAAAVTLHARTAEQLYAGSARWEAIATLRAAVGGVPVLGNGDGWEAADALAMVDATGCAGGCGCTSRRGPHGGDRGDGG